MYSLCPAPRATLSSLTTPIAPATSPLLPLVHDNACRTAHAFKPIFRWSLGASYGQILSGIELLKTLQSAIDARGATVALTAMHATRLNAANVTRLLLPIKAKLEAARRLDDTALDRLAAVTLMLHTLSAPPDRARLTILRLATHVASLKSLMRDSEHEELCDHMWKLHLLASWQVCLCMRHASPRFRVGSSARAPLHTHTCTRTHAPAHVHGHGHGHGHGHVHVPPVPAVCSSHESSTEAQGAASRIVAAPMWWQHSPDRMATPTAWPHRPHRSATPLSTPLVRPPSALADSRHSPPRPLPSRLVQSALSESTRCAFLFYARDILPALVKLAQGLPSPNALHALVDAARDAEPLLRRVTAMQVHPLPGGAAGTTSASAHGDAVAGGQADGVIAGEGGGGAGGDNGEATWIGRLRHLLLEAVTEEVLSPLSLAIETDLRYAQHVSSTRAASAPQLSISGTTGSTMPPVAHVHPSAVKSLYRRGVPAATPTPCDADPTATAVAAP